MASCQAVEEDATETLEIGWPTDVQHVAHVTFDRYNGFLGLPEEFVVEVPPRAPSARYYQKIPLSSCIFGAFKKTKVLGIL